VVAATSSDNITLVGARSIERSTDFVTGGDLFANTLNEEFDSVVIFAQQVDEKADRGLKAPITDPTDINMTLPTKTSRRGKVLAFNETTGDPVAGPDLSAMTTVIAQSANINTVAANIGSVNTVAGNTSNINTVADISGNVTTVAGIQASVTTVAGNTTNINAVAGNSTNINAVAGNATNINAVNANKTNIDAVAGDLTDIGIVAGIAADVTTVASIADDIPAAAAIDPADLATVAGIAPDVTTVANIAANVTTVANNDANITAVAGDAADIGTVATNITNVNAVGSNISNVNAVAGNATNINAVVANASNINQVASNTVAINAASANATAAAASATAAAGSATSAANSAALANAVSLANEPVRHSVRPSLLLDFANTKALDPRITFARASTARFYDGKTVAKAEENLLTFSQEFDNAAWTKTNATVTANTTTAPDGTSTAEKLVSTSASIGPDVRRTPGVSITSGTVFTASFFAKAGEVSLVAINNFDTASRTTYFNLATGTVGTVAAGSTATITDVGNGWYRCTTTRTAAAVTTLGFTIQAQTTEGTWSQTIGDGLFLWGAQLEQRSSVTAYTPTTTQPITNYVPVLQSAANNVARFDHNPVTGESLGLLIEEQRTNLLVRSEEFDNASWTRFAVTVTPNTVVAPDGTLTADKLVENTSNALHRVTQQSFSAGTYTLTVYAKAAESTRFELVTTPVDVGFDLSNGTILFGTGGSIAAVGNGWYRCSVTFTVAVTHGIGYGLLNSSNQRTYTGDGYSGIYIWGAQLEAGAFPTSYIPTVATQVTRSADRASMNNIGSLLNIAEGTLYVSGIAPPGLQPSGNSFGFAVLSDGTSNNRARLVRNGLDTNSFFGVTSNGATQASITMGALSNNSLFKAAGAYKTNDFATSLNGSSVGVDTLGATVTALNTLDIGHQGGTGLTETNSCISKIAYYPLRLTNAQLQALTQI
jgi:hypothetical protein